MIEYDSYLVAFIDILGQKESFKNQGKYIDVKLNSLDNDAFQVKLINAHKETAITIENLRNGSKSFLMRILPTKNQKSRFLRGK